MNISNTYRVSIFKLQNLRPLCKNDAIYFPGVEKSPRIINQAA